MPGCSNGLLKSKYMRGTAPALAQVKYRESVNNGAVRETSMMLCDCRLQIQWSKVMESQTLATEFIHIYKKKKNGVQIKETFWNLINRAGFDWHGFWPQGFCAIRTQIPAILAQCVLLIAAKNDRFWFLAALSHLLWNLNYLNLAVQCAALFNSKIDFCSHPGCTISRNQRTVQNNFWTSSEGPSCFPLVWEVFTRKCFLTSSRRPTLGWLKWIQICEES